MHIEKHQHVSTVVFNGNVNAVTKDKWPHIPLLKRVSWPLTAEVVDFPIWNHDWIMVNPNTSKSMLYATYWRWLGSSGTCVIKQHFIFIHSHMNHMRIS